MKERIALAIACITFLTGAGEYNAALGLGMKSCSVWTQQRQGGGAESAKQWLLGYLSGLNVVTPSMIIMDEEGNGVVLQLDDYCTSHPAANITSAASALVLSEYDGRRRLMERSLELMKKK